MKVTKELKNYIERKLNERRAATLSGKKAVKDMDAAEAERKELVMKAAEIVGKAKDEIKKIVAKSKYCEIDTCRWSDVVEFHRDNIVPDERIKNAFTKANEESNARLYENLDEIVVTMSLGGTKEDLDRLISEVLF